MPNLDRWTADMRDAPVFTLIVRIVVSSRRISAYSTPGRAHTRQYANSANSSHCDPLITASFPARTHRQLL